MEKDLIEFIARSLVTGADKVDVTTIEGDRSTILELKVDEKDVGKVIGKYGRIARAMRNILDATSNNSGKRFVLEILS
ncbi:KH domain RNA binding protein YlqC [Olavius algarvensis spirochete endosymbiont]|uniref:KH domain-containing protein n=1 Tax=Olavius algarvensis spirochete endosymbiont TaxID=260710 RepID=UPI000F1A57DB|nr:KH domain-containing protein [Olavius algarvensis spirochete endosymbiont]VDA99628.1 KH domain RNA binding protein YlqC [Olavius algarvensis spirochete endosymbiont]